MSRTTLCLLVSVVICFVLLVSLSGERSVFPGNDSVNIVDISSASEATGSYSEESKSNVEVGSIISRMPLLVHPQLIELNISFICKDY